MIEQKKINADDMGCKKENVSLSFLQMYVCCTHLCCYEQFVSFPFFYRKWTDKKADE